MSDKILRQFLSDLSRPAANARAARNPSGGGVAVPERASDRLGEAGIPELIPGIRGLFMRPWRNGQLAL